VNRALSGAMDAEFKASMDRGESKDADAGAEEAARVAGELAVEADDERHTIDAEAATIEAGEPGTTEAARAAAVKARADAEADAAIAASLDSDTAAADARQHSRLLHHDAADVEADYHQATADVSVAASDLADIDTLEASLQGEVPPAPAPPTGA